MTEKGLRRASTVIDAVIRTAATATTISVHVRNMRNPTAECVRDSPHAIDHLLKRVFGIGALAENPGRLVTALICHVVDFKVPKCALRPFVCATDRLAGVVVARLGV